MNNEQIMSFIRQILLALGGGLVTKGYIDNGTLTAIVGGLMALGTAVWGLYVRRANGLIASAATVPTVQKIVTDDKTASVVPSDKVVSGN